VELLAHLGPHGGGFAWLNLMLPLALAAGVFFLLRRRAEVGDGEEKDESALTERYANGKISEEEYRKRIRVLRESH
jgi:uncharacterized membrane protein